MHIGHVGLVVDNNTQAVGSGSSRSLELLFFLRVLETRAVSQTRRRTGGAAEGQPPGGGGWVVGGRLGSGAALQKISPT